MAIPYIISEGYENKIHIEDYENHEYVFTHFGVEYRFSFFISEKEYKEKISDIIINHRNKIIENVLNKN